MDTEVVQAPKFRHPSFIRAVMRLRLGRAGISVVPRSSCLPESSSRLSAPARPCGRGRLAQFSLLQRFAVWWVALPWPILPVSAVLLALCRVVVFFRVNDEPSWPSSHLGIKLRL